MADLTGLEQQRQALEASLQKLPQGLKYWQTYEAECEGLKEEFLDAPPPIDDVKVIEIAKSYDGELMTEKIVLELAGLDKGRLRPFNQILRDLEHRQEYMRKNIETLQRQFFDVENRLETFDFAASRDIDTGLPLTEIEEELDDDDNVISGRVHSADQSKSQLLESLKKAGITGGELDGGWKAEQQLKPAITKASPPIPSNPALAPVPMKRTSLRATPTVAEMLLTASRVLGHLSGRSLSPSPWTQRLLRRSCASNPKMARRQCRSPRRLR